MQARLQKLLGWLIIPVTSFILAIQNNPFRHNYSDLRMSEVFGTLYLFFALLMGMYLFVSMYILGKSRKFKKIYFIFLFVSLILFFAGNLLPYYSNLGDVLSARHVDLILIALAIYGILFSYYLSIIYFELGRLKYLVVFFLLGCMLLIMVFQRVNSVLELFFSVTLAVLLERLCNREMSFDI